MDSSSVKAGRLALGSSVGLHRQRAHPKRLGVHKRTHALCCTQPSTLHATRLLLGASCVARRDARCALRSASNIARCALRAAHPSSMALRLHRLGLRAAHLSVVAALGVGDGRTVGAAAASNKLRPKPPAHAVNGCMAAAMRRPRWGHGRRAAADRRPACAAAGLRTRRRGRRESRRDRGSGGRRAQCCWR